MSAAAPLYEIRSPEQTILYSVVASELETFLAEQRSAEHEVPRFVEREFRAFLECRDRMKNIAAIESPEVARRILDCLGIVSVRRPCSRPAGKSYN